MLALYIFLVILMIVGVIGAVVPAIPGSSLILISITIWGLVNGFSNVLAAFIVALVVFLLCLGIDFLSSYVGAKYAGASNWGQIGAIIGLILGIFGLLPAFLVGGPLIGILVGPFLGAVIGEFFYRKDLEFKNRIESSLKAGLGIVIGSVIGNIIQGLLALVPVIVFLFTTWPRS